MKTKHVGDRYANFDDGTCWPMPEPYDSDRHSDRVAWRLRYGQPDKSDLLIAAEFMAAYEALLYKPAKRRQEIVMAIRDAVEQRDAE